MLSGVLYLFICLLLTFSTGSDLMTIVRVTDENFFGNFGFRQSTYSLLDAIPSMSVGLNSTAQDPLGQDFYLDAPGPYLFTDACHQPDGQPNCTFACSNTAAMFGTLKTLHNCQLYPVVAYLYANGSLSSESKQLVQDLRIEPNKTDPSESIILQSISQCLVDYCNDNLNGCQGINETFTGSASYWEELVNSLCEDSFFPVNSDVGGIGVRSCKVGIYGQYLIYSRSMCLTGYRLVLPYLPS